MTPEQQNVWEIVKWILSYALIPLGIFLFREVRQLAEAMNKINVRLVRVETTIFNRRSTDHHEDEE